MESRAANELNKKRGPAWSIILWISNTVFGVICVIIYLILHGFVDISPVIDNFFAVIITITVILGIIFFWGHDRTLSTKNDAAIVVSKRNLKFLAVLLVPWVVLILGLFFWSTWAPSIPVVGPVPVWPYQIMVYGSIIAWYLLNLWLTKPWLTSLVKPPVEFAVKPILKKTGWRWIGYLILLVGMYLGLIVLVGGKIDPISGFLGIFIAQFSPIMVPIFILTGIGLLKYLRIPPIHPGKIKIAPRRAAVVLGIGTIGLSLVLCLPLFAVPVIIPIAERDCDQAYGQYWDYIAPEDQPYFRKTPFSLTEYYLGPKMVECRVIPDVIFYDGAAGINPTDLAENVRLSCDIYLPPDGSANLPGQNSTLIRIHGGAWVFGDKGWGNMPLMNRYFAAQGYVVFDVQYGLFDAGWAWDTLTPARTKGNFSIDDMVRHLGIFTQFLVNNSASYGANPNSVFISGGSAGGQLTCAMGLALNHPDYSALFGSGITLKGIIPFYPANGLAYHLEINGDPNLSNPINLVTPTSPPCLIFQGTQDALVDPGISFTFREEYINKGNPRCVVIEMPFAGHGADISFSGSYNQVFLYYMERFMYYYR
jgi:acetyl esterase/lipase